MELRTPAKDLKEKVCKPTADLTLSCHGLPDLEKAEGGTPFLVLEAKDPNGLSFEQMQAILTDFSSYIDDDSEQELFRSHKIIRFRLVHCLMDDLIDDLAERGLQPIANLYSKLLYKRQTFGLIASSQWHLAMAIDDWHHANEPGQHATVTLIRNEQDIAVPQWPLGGRVPDLFKYALSTAVLQLSTGLVSARVFEQVISTLAEKHARYAQLIFRQGPSSEPTCRAATQDTNHRLLDLIQDDRSRTELERLLSLDETTTAIPFRKEELLRVLCALFPYDPVVRKRGIRSAASFDRANRDRSFNEVATDHLVLSFGGIWNGWLPAGYCERLASVEYPEAAKAKAARLQSREQPVSNSVLQGPSSRVSVPLNAPNSGTGTSRKLMAMHDCN
ncbi:uncharacterized protein SRS1_14983 [Sporisorium reilianum f. sp. reilianum]|uniref:Uncharacterized protein n=1 Tax=Sporisorium reilianum f. sp. reilianum TaxID=72559 RepID=A0A2N8UHA2_9BASI|nr:uncharacterized protein SRS1_14983 [Sporisorium reilianum f. sp. reilianum]